MVETGTTELARPIPGLETVEPVQPAPERPWAQAPAETSPEIGALRSETALTDSTSPKVSPAVTSLPGSGRSQ